MPTIAYFVTKVDEVEVDVVEAMEGGSNLKHQYRHMSTHNHQLPTDNCVRTKRELAGWPM